MVEPIQHLRKHKFDWGGVVTLLGWSGLLVFALETGGRDNPWLSAPVLGTFAASALLFVAFIVIELRATEPLIPLDLFKVPALRAATVITCFLGMSMFGVLSFIPLYGRTVLGESATGSGQILIPLMLAMMVGSAGGARLVLKVGFRVIVTSGAVAVAVGTFLLTRLTAESGQPALSIFLIILGFGMGLIFMSTSLAAQNSVALPRMGVATGLVNFTRQLGGAVGVAIAASVMLTSLTARLTEEFGAGAIDTNQVLAPTSQQSVPPAVRDVVSDAFSGALNQVFWVAFVIALIGLACTVLMPRGNAARLRDDARRESKFDSVSPEGETYEITSSVA
jgi:hypothetical protein